MNRIVRNGRRARLMCGTGFAAACLMLGAPAYAGENDEAPAGAAQPLLQEEEAAPAEGDEPVVITGSRLANRGATAPTPVTVLGSEEVGLSGTVNVETLLNDTPQFVGSQNSGPTGNTVPGGTANVNLRGFGEQRNLVLVNGRRFAISGPAQTTDLNTIPASLIARTEIVTGGSSAVYGSDAITGVVNFIMRDDFEGVEAHGDVRFDAGTGTPTYNFDLTFGGNFADGRGNVVASINYLKRNGLTRGERGGPMAVTLGDGCVTSASWSDNAPGTPLAVPAGQTCRGAGGIPGFIFGGSGTIPNGRFANIPLFGAAGNTPAYNAALVAAGLQNMTSRGFTFNDGGTTVRPAVTPGDDYDLSPAAYLILPQERWMGNVFAHYDFAPGVTGYAEVHYSSNRVVAQIPPSGAGGNFLYDVNNPYLSAAMQEVLRQLDMRETGTSSVTNGTLTMTTTPNDGRVILNTNRRLVDVGNRVARSDREVFRAAVGVRGDIGDVSEDFLTNLSYDAYYSYARTSYTEVQNGAISLSRFQQNLLRQGGAAPVLNIFGQNITPAAARAVAITSISFTETTQEVLASSLTGEIFQLPYGPVDFNLGVERRSAFSDFAPDNFLATGDVSGFNASLPTRGTQAVTEVFGEVRLPLLREVPGFERLTVNGAFRRSKYDGGIGSVWTYSVGGEWAPVKDIALRGQFQHAIRAPNVGELFGGRSQSGPTGVDPCSSRQPVAQQTAAVRAVCVATGVPAAAVFTLPVQPDTFIRFVQGGNPNVGPEISDTFTAGLVLQPRFVPRLTVTLDYFNIKLDGAIAPLGGGAQNTLNLCYNVIQDANSEFCQAIFRDRSTGQIVQPNYIQVLNANTGGLKTSGFDLEVNYNVPLGFGAFSENSRLEFNTYQTWTREFTGIPVQALPALTNECVGAFGQTCGQPIPEWKGATRLTWRDGPFALSLRHRYIGEVTVDTYVLPSRRAGATPPPLDSLSAPVMKTQHYFDLTAMVQPTDAMELTFGVRNLFDKYPPVVGSSSPAANTFAATYDSEGAVFFVGATVKF
jgi:iron complex outermembrane receptor protein